MLHQSFGGAVIFLSLEHFIAPALIKNIHLLMKKYAILDIILRENIFYIVALMDKGAKLDLRLTKSFNIHIVRHSPSLTNQEGKTDKNLKL